MDSVVVLLATDNWAVFFVVIVFVFWFCLSRGLIDRLRRHAKIGEWVISHQRCLLWHARLGQVGHAVPAQVQPCRSGLESRVRLAVGDRCSSSPGCVLTQNKINKNKEKRYFISQIISHMYFNI